MLIENSQTIITSPANLSPEKNSYRWPLVLGTIITLTALALPIVIAIAPNTPPTGSLLSPLPEGTIASDAIASASASPSASTAAIIALPTDEKATPSGESYVGSSANKQILAFPAQTRELAVTDPLVTDNSSIYLTPLSATNSTLYIKSKGQGYFTIAIDSPAEAELLLEYYVVND